MKRRTLLSALTAAAVALPGMSLAQDLDEVTLRLKWLPQAQFVGFYMAVEKGYYEEEGLDLTINPGGPNLLTENLVATGADTFGLSGGSDSVFAARSKDLPIVCIGVAHQLTPFIFVAQEDGPVKEVTDFEGKTVATWFTGANHVLSAMLSANGVDPADVDIQPQQVSVTPFVDGQVDVITATRYNEFDTIVTRMGRDALKVFDPEDYGVSFPRDTLIVTEDYLAENPDKVEGFLRASAKGWLDAFADKPAAIDLIMEVAPTLERPHQEFMLDEIERLMLAGAAAEKGLFAVDMDAISTAHDLFVEYGVLPEPIDLSAAFDSTIIDSIPAEDRLP